ncbi:unnamed protein product [Pleuronectes platessa]|uniref:Uncharacterized protein n=1 Tax=Pleuronectes platessa TaxID=8262 RepID=A0A9N7UB90_PLEPL|nr:unnamed protein product [Pleuronectes platessa]
MVLNCGSAETCSSSTTPRLNNLNTPLSTWETSGRKLNTLSGSLQTKPHYISQGTGREKKTQWYSHKNSEEQNSDTNLQSQFSHVFPAVWRRHVHASQIIRVLTRNEGGSGNFWMILTLYSTLTKPARSTSGCSLITDAARLHRDSAKLKQSALRLLLLLLLLAGARLRSSASVSGTSGDFLFYCNCVADNLLLYRVKVSPSYSINQLL